ncbi:MAG: hypothetical protein R3F50_18680 [Gammaproteobacteria bacterium]
MKHYFIPAVAILLLLTNLSATAQQSHPQYPAVKQVIDQFFTSINTGNGELLASLEVGGGRIQTVVQNTVGSYDFVERAWFGPDNFDADTRLTERYWSEELLISDHLAVFWAPYDLHINGTFSHCGIDLLNLVKVDGQWKIGHAMWTTQRQGCDPSPLGPLN